MELLSIKILHQVPRWRCVRGRRRREHGSGGRRHYCARAPAGRQRRRRCREQQLERLRLAKLLRLGRLAKKFEKLAAAKAFRVMQFTAILLVIAHWYACIWFWMGSSNPPQLDEAMQVLSRAGIRSIPAHPPTPEELFLREYGDAVDEHGDAAGRDDGVDGPVPA